MKLVNVGIVSSSAHMFDTVSVTSILSRAFQAHETVVCKHRGLLIVLKVACHFLSAENEIISLCEEEHKA